MRKALVVAIVGFALAFASSSRAEEPKNLIENGGFENDQAKKGIPDGWVFDPCAWTGSQGVIDWTKEVKHSGEYAVKLQQTNDKGRLSVRYAGKIPVQPGESYLLTGWMKTDFAADNDKGRAYFVINEYKGDEFVREAGTTTIVMKAADWAKYKLPFQIPAGISQIEIMFTINNGAGTIWVDDVSLVNVRVADPHG